MWGGGVGAGVSSWLNKRISGGASAKPFNNHATLSNGLVSYWKLDEQSGARYDSVVASANDLTDNNTVTYRNAGPAGVKAVFTGANSEYLSNNTIYDAATIGDFTVGLWLFEGTSVARRPFVVATTALGATFSVSASFSGGQFFPTVFDSVSGISQPFINLVDAATDYPRYLVFGYDSTTKKAFASVDGSAKVSNGSALTNGPKSGTFLSIATNSGGSNDQSQARMGYWNRVLSDSEILDMYNAGSGKAYSQLSAANRVSLLSYWDLSEASGDRADSVGSKTLTDNNTVTSATNSVPPPKNIAARFTAANGESLSRTNASLVNWPTGNFHLAFWAYSQQDVASAAGELVSKRSGGQIEWRLETNGSAGVSDRVYLYASSDGAAEDVSVNLGVGSLPFRTWTFVELRRTGTTIGIAANGGAFTDGSLSAVFNGTAPFQMGCENVTPALFYNGNLDAVGIWSRVLTAGERSDLYASGAGLFY